MTAGLRRRITTGACRLALTAVLLLQACSGPRLPASEAPPLQPEPGSGLRAKPGWASHRLAVAAAHPLATEAGYRMLRAGGSAVDAAVAVQMVLALVEPQSSGIGGGALLLHWDGAELAALDGRETAPAGADERQFLQPDGRPMPFMTAVAGGLSVGVPGAVRMLEMAHRRYGRLPWAQLFEPAIALAEQGFAVSERLHALLAGFPTLRRDPLAGGYFFQPDGQPWPAGHRLRNPALAAVLRRIAAEGSAALHEGAVAADIARRVRADARHPGRLAIADLAGYRALQRDAICTTWRLRWRICGFPPPSSGHLAAMQILGLIDHAAAGLPMRVDGIPGPDWLHRYAEASRLAFADRGQFVADPAFAAAPAGRWTSLLDDGYLRRRAALIGELRMPAAPPGRPGDEPLAWAPQPEQVEQGTSHVSIVDADGHALAMTTTIEFGFGAQLMSDGGTGLAGGFLLNNELTDFAFVPTGAGVGGRPVANRVQPGKRPRSSMSPTLVFDARDGRLLMTLGSPGGAAIIHFVARTLLATLGEGLDVQRAIDQPNFADFGGPLLLEAGRFPAATVAALVARGHGVQQVELASGLQAIERTSDGWYGGADPRRDGNVMGD